MSANWNNQAQLAATAVVSGAVVASAILGYQQIRRKELIEDLKSSIPELDKNHHADKVRVYVTSPGFTDLRSEAHGFWSRSTSNGYE